MEKLINDAKWIWQNEDGQKNTWLCFRKNFIIDELGGAYFAQIGAECKYWLWINGVLAVKEGGLNRGPMPDDGYYDETEITQFLKQGKNTIAILVWYWGNEGRNNKDCGKGGLLFHLDLGSNTILSDQTWKMHIHPSFKESGEPLPAYLYGGYNIIFDKTEDLIDWQQCGFNDEMWDHAVEKGSLSSYPWNDLYKRPIPMWKDYGLKEYSNIKQDGNVITAVLPYAAHVSPVINLKSKTSGQVIDIRTDRYFVPGGPGDNHHVYNSHRAEYITTTGEQEYELLSCLYGEQVIYTIPNDIEVLSLKYRETGYDCEFEGSFCCDDDFYNDLYEKCRRTLYVCMRDNFMDCPDRERGQWIGDVSTQVPQVFYALGRSADLLVEKSINDFFNWKKDDVLRGNIPGSRPSELPSQSLNAISEIGMIMSYYQNTGDRSCLLKSMKSIIQYLLLWEMGDDGLVAPRKGNWYWFDHGKNIDEKVLENAWYYLALKAVFHIAYISGESGNLDELTDRKKSIEENFNKVLWKTDGYYSKDFKDDRANAMAVLSGLACSEKYEIIKNILLSVENATPYMEGYVLEALYEMGYQNEALFRMKKRYTSLVDNENSTLWEDFNVLGTKNHAWSGAPLTLLCKWVAGIYPKDVGYQSYYVMPHLGDLNNVKVVVPTVKGKIEVQIFRTKKEFAIKVLAPSGLKAVIGIPKCAFADIEIEKIILNNDEVLFDQSLQDIKGQKGFYVFEVSKSSIEIVAYSK